LNKQYKLLASVYIAMQVFLRVSQVGADAGPNFELYSDTGAVFPLAATKTQLLNGLILEVDSRASQITVSSSGGCAKSRTVIINKNCTAPTITPTRTPDITTTPTPTPTLTRTPTRTPDTTTTPTPTPTLTRTPTRTPDITTTPTPTPTRTPISTPTPDLRNTPLRQASLSRDSLDYIFDLNTGQSFNFQLFDQIISFSISSKRVKQNGSIVILALRENINTFSILLEKDFSSGAIKFNIGNPLEGNIYQYNSLNQENPQLKEWNRGSFIQICQ
jgi:hypothetical protein